MQYEPGHSGIITVLGKRYIYNMKFTKLGKSFDTDDDIRNSATYQYIATHTNKIDAEIIEGIRKVQESFNNSIAVLPV